MRSSDKTGKLMAALAKAQADLQDPKQSQRGHHGTYASLADGLPGARQVLASHGVALMQSVDLERCAVITRLAHGDEWLEGDYPLIMNSSKPQQQGANMTYARRYALWAMLGLAPEDDDGQASTTNSKGNHRNWRKNPPILNRGQRSGPRDPEKWDGFVEQLKKLGWSVEDLEGFLIWSGGKTPAREMSAEGRFALLQKLAEPDEGLQTTIVDWSRR